MGSGNDLYIDDIVLEKVTSGSTTEINCANSSIDDVIKAEDDQLIFETGRFNIEVV